MLHIHEGIPTVDACARGNTQTFTVLKHDFKLMLKVVM